MVMCRQEGEWRAARRGLVDGSQEPRKARITVVDKNAIRRIGVMSRDERVETFFAELQTCGSPDELGWLSRHV